MWKVSREELQETAPRNTPIIFPMRFRPITELLGLDVSEEDGNF